jgi:hypothetical protein
MATGYISVQQMSYDEHMRQIQYEMMKDAQRNPHLYQPGRSQLGDWDNPNGYSTEPQPKKLNKVLLLLNR